MATSQVDVKLAHSAAKGVRSEFLVHVDGISAGQVSEEDSEVLDAASVLLEDFRGGDDLALNSADLVLTLHEVPETGSSTDGVWSEHTHSVELWGGDSLSWESSADNVELSDLQQI